MTTGKVSIIIPSRNERFLSKTIIEILAKAQGDIEVIAVLDGYWPKEHKTDHYETPAIVQDPRVIYLHKPQSEGMRPAINYGVAIAKGEYILKCDGHVLFDEGFDVKLKEHCEQNWIVIPRRKRLDAERFAIQDVGKPDIDYEYLSYPDNPADFGGPGLNGRIWTERILERRDNPKYDIDENMSFQGSCWFTTKKYFYYLDLMDTENFGPFWNEAQELGFKTWLSGGKVMINKKTWYAHLHKGKTYGRGYSLDEKWLGQGAEYTRKWLHNKKMWNKQIYPLTWLLEHFMPMPGWTQEKIDDIKSKMQ